MQIDVEALLAPVSEDAPTGIDLSDDNDRLALDDVFESVQRNDFDGEEPNWRAVTDEVVQMLRRSKDLWLAVYLCRAGARLGDLEQVAGGARLLAGLLQSWDTVYPSLDDVGAQGRKSRCAELAQRRAFLSALEAVPLLSDSRHGAFAVADLELFAGEGEGSNVGFARIMQADGKMKLSESLGHLDSIVDAIKRCDAAFTENAQSSADRPDFAPLMQSLRRMQKAVGAFVGAPAAAADDDGGEDEASSAPAAPSGGGGAPGAIRNRDDVVKALDAICAYYARNEPASPVPLALKRARAWVTLDFLTVLRDIAPDSLSDARRVLMQSETEDERDSRDDDD
jgi:type VI secretion system protein ImpA